ncbi:MAG: purine-binding chemotaxis protein CheW [Opitutaceae bacterium]|nr:purine-binding chemotaxis protein CheW [Opitutaceae bacterium]
MSKDSIATAASPIAGLAGRYLLFSLAKESYAIEVARTREIIRLTEITPIPQLPSFVRGVINLRSKIVPIVDLRAKFGMPPEEPTERTSIVVVHVKGSGGAMVWIGFIVDDVDEVTNIGAAELEPVPDFGLQVDTGYMRAMAKTKKGVTTLLDVDHVVSGDVVARATQMASAAF